MTDPALSESAHRRARREWRRRRRRNGKRLIFASYVVIAVAVIVGAAGLLSSSGDDDGDTSTDGGSATDGRSSRDRGLGTTATDETVVIDLFPSTSVGSVGNDEVVSGESFGIRTVFGIMQIRAAPRAQRPDPNRAPTVSAPNHVDRDANGDSVVSGITIQDRDYPGTGDIGVLLIVQGTVTVRLNQDVQLLTPNTNAFVALSGPPEALNRALADLRVHTDGATELLIGVTDWGYGDLPRAESGSATTVVG